MANRDIEFWLSATPGERVRGILELNRELELVRELSYRHLVSIVVRIARSNSARIASSCLLIFFEHLRGTLRVATKAEVGYELAYAVNDATAIGARRSSCGGSFRTLVKSRELRTR